MLSYLASFADHSVLKASSSALVGPVRVKYEIFDRLGCGDLRRLHFDFV